MASIHGIEISVISAVGSTGLAASAAALYASAGARSMDAAMMLNSGALEQLTEAALALQVAQQEASLGAVVLQTAQEMDAALLDILI